MLVPMSPMEAYEDQKKMLERENEYLAKKAKEGQDSAIFVSSTSLGNSKGREENMIRK